MRTPLKIVFLGLTLSSSWGNGHATTYRALIKGLDALGHSVLFLERDKPWYAQNRDLPDPDFCVLRTYAELAELASFESKVREADVVCIGSYVPDGAQIIDWAKEKAGGALCFYDIDTPVTLSLLRDGEHAHLRPDHIPLFDRYFSFAGGRALDRLRTGFGARDPRILYCAVDETIYRPTGESPLWDIGYLGTYSPDRQPALERLLIEPARRLPELRFVVAGPQYPSAIEWPENVERIEHLPPVEHPSFYARQRFTLNVTRADMIASGWSPSVRLFEAGACGTPVISDRWDGLNEIFPGGAVEIADETADVVRLLTGKSPVQVRTQSEMARRIVMQEHTGVARAQQFVDAALAGRASQYEETSSVRKAG